jgi:hypothetical protein
VGVVGDVHEVDLMAQAEPIIYKPLLDSGGGGVLRDALRTMILGSIIGFGVALFGSRLLNPLLFGVGPGDPVTMAGVFLVILAMSMLAAYAPVRHATRVDPRVALTESD